MRRGEGPHLNNGPKQSGRSPGELSSTRGLESRLPACSFVIALYADWRRRRRPEAHCRNGSGGFAAVPDLRSRGSISPDRDDPVILWDARSLSEVNNVRRRKLHHFLYGASLETSIAWWHGGQLLVLLPEFDMVIVTTADPFFHSPIEMGWPHEVRVVDLVGRFINTSRRAEPRMSSWRAV